jgi:hypothetical protein
VAGESDRAIGVVGAAIDGGDGETVVVGGSVQISDVLLGHDADEMW